MSRFADPFEYSAPRTEFTHHFDDNDGYLGDNSQQFASFAGGSGAFELQQRIYGTGGEFSAEDNGTGLDGEFGGLDGPILPPPSDMGTQEGFALREWRRLNAIRLEEKEKREKELLSQIIEEADEYKVQFFRKREISRENNKETNREKEKLFLASQEKFYAEANKNYWKAIAELIPTEVPSLNKRVKKDQEKKAAVVVIQGPKPGKPTELSRMQQMLLKLKHEAPPHLNLSPEPAATIEEVAVA